MPQPPKYVLEWWGFNQFEEVPVVIDERYVCGNIVHILRISYHEDFGGLPDMVLSADTGEERPDILERIVGWKYPHLRQLELFPGLYVN